MISFKFILILLIFIVVIHTLALANNWYWIYSWLDILVHFLGGFWVAAVFLRFADKYFSQISQFQNFLISLVIVLSFTALIGVLLEFTEFFYDIFISSRGYSGFLQLGAADTIADLFFDLLGGLFFLIIYYGEMRYRRR